ncbi:hypothetical protein [Ferruginibacter sp.]|nr:hypothetical protein [Ferruginibacter sp.]
MKKILPVFLLALTAIAQAQTKTISQAIITTKTTTVSPEGEDDLPPPPQSVNGEEVRVMRFGGDGETKSVTTLKGAMVKTFSESEMGRTTVLRDNTNKKTTTLMEMMGNKTGFYVTDEEQEVMRKQMDSMMQTRRQGNDNNALTGNAPKSTEIIYVEESKKIAGQVCKKAFIVTIRQNGTKDSSTVWYCPDFKLEGIASTGGLSGFGNFGRTTSLGGLSDIAGFPMQYEMKLNRGRKMIVEVTKLVIDKEIADKEFEIPKDFVVKPMKDMQTGNGRGFQIRMGGPGN